MYEYSIYLKNIAATAIIGHETTAHTLSFVVYSLARNPAVQARAQKEVDAFLAENASGEVCRRTSKPFDDIYSSYLCCDLASRRPYISSLSGSGDQRIDAEVSNGRDCHAQESDCEGRSETRSVALNREILDHSGKLYRGASV